MLYHIDSEQRLVLCTMHSVVTVDEYAEFYNNLAAELESRPSHDQLMDLRYCDDIDFHPTFEHLAARAIQNPFTKQSRRAFVTDNDVVIGNINIVNRISLGGAGELVVFSHMQEAKRWLGLPIDSEDELSAQLLLSA